MEIRLPKLGEGAESGTVVNILVKEGDTVEKGQTLLELENEKAVAPIPSTAAGTLEALRVSVGDEVSVGQVLAVLKGDKGGQESAEQEEAPEPEEKTSDRQPSRSRPKDREEEPEEEEEPSPEPTGKEPVAPPSVRKLARQVGLDLGRVPGTGSGGRITLEDLRRYVKRLQSGSGPRAAKSSEPPSEQIDFSQWGRVETEAMSPIRRTISRRMAESWRTIPHVTQFDEVDITELNQRRKKFAPDYEAKGTKLTLTPLVLLAVARTLDQHPIFKASLDEADQKIVHKQYCHLGLAVDTDQGLLVPVIRDADQKSLLELAREVGELAERARQRKLSLDDMKGGTFTISNQGGIGGGFFTPIINKPEVAILGLGRGRLHALYSGREPSARLLLPVGLSYDHRLIDGGAAARFVTDLGKALAGLNESDFKIAS